MKDLEEYRLEALEGTAKVFKDNYLEVFKDSSSSLTEEDLELLANGTARSVMEVLEVFAQVVMENAVMPRVLEGLLKKSIGNN